MQNASSLNDLKPGSDYLLQNSGDVFDTINWIKDIIKMSSEDESIKSIAKELAKSKDPLKAVFDYAYKSIAYEPDPGSDLQRLRFATRSIADNKGNCTAYSILISSLLTVMRVPHYLRVAGYQQPRRFEHIYVVTESGTVLDPVIGQRQDGTDTLNNRDGGHFNKEVPYITKKDFKMRIQALRGLGCSDCGGTCGGCGTKGVDRVWRAQTLGVDGYYQKLLKAQADAKARKARAQDWFNYSNSNYSSWAAYVANNCGRSVSGCNSDEINKREALRAEVETWAAELSEATTSLSNADKAVNDYQKLSPEDKKKTEDSDTSGKKNIILASIIGAASLLGIYLYKKKK